MACKLLLTVQPVPPADSLPALRGQLEKAFPRAENSAYFDALWGRPAHPPLPRVTAERLGALSLLPSLLAAAGVDTAPLLLHRDGYGRPYCTTDDGSVGFDFNLSHTQAHVAGALLLGAGRVGVDIEEPIPPARALPLIRRYCTEGEHARFAGLTEDADMAALFTRIWTEREALAKQDGQGMPLRFDCSAIPPKLWLWQGQLPGSRTTLTLCAPSTASPHAPCILPDSLPIVCV